jgi:hemolysin III
MERWEKFHSLSHCVGLLASAVGLVVLVDIAVRQGDPWKMVSFSVYGVSLILLYTASTFYHGLTNARAKSIFKTLDHCAIYLLIAGTCTPFMLIALRGAWGWTLFGIEWGLAIIGICIEVFAKQKVRVASVILYLVMGWLIVIAKEPLVQALTIEGVQWLMIGGLFYTVGVVFYALTHKVRYAHSIWHVFVLCGSASHFYTVYRFVA